MRLCLNVRGISKMDEALHEFQPAPFIYLRNLLSTKMMTGPNCECKRIGKALDRPCVAQASTMEDLVPIGPIMLLNLYSALLYLHTFAVRFRGVALLCETRQQ